MSNKIRVFLWCIVYVIAFVALTKLDDWGREEEAKQQPVFRYNPYTTHM